MLRPASAADRSIEAILDFVYGFYIITVLAIEASVMIGVIVI
jgi:hypothetical protein